MGGRPTGRIVKRAGGRADWAGGRATGWTGELDGRASGVGGRGRLSWFILPVNTKTVFLDYID